jgi:hypothetical protein
MSHRPIFAVYRLAITAAITLTIGTAAFGQAANEAPAEEDAEAPEIVEIEDIAELGTTADVEVIEEIIVVSPRPGSRRRVDEEYEDPVRAQLLKEFYRMKELEEEYEWRKPDASESSSRIKWGYDPRDEYRMRNEMDLQDLSWEKEKPATIFRVEF